MWLDVRVLANECATHLVQRCPSPCSAARDRIQKLSCQLEQYEHVLAVNTEDKENLQTQVNILDGVCGIGFNYVMEVCCMVWWDVL